MRLCVLACECGRRLVCFRCVVVVVGFVDVDGGGYTRARGRRSVGRDMVRTHTRFLSECTAHGVSDTATRVATLTLQHTHTHTQTCAHGTLGKHLLGCLCVRASRGSVRRTCVFFLRVRIIRESIQCARLYRCMCWCAQG